MGTARLAAAAAAVSLFAAPAARASDIVVPAHGASRGTVMLMHPGGWGYGNPTLVAADAQAFARAGWRSIAIEYPLMNIRAAYAAVEARAAQLRPDAGPLIAIGESAGATMAEWLAARRLVDAAVAVDGPSNLLHWKAVEPGGLLTWIPLLVAGFQQSRWDLSPVRIFHAETAAPLLVVLAEADQYVEREQGTQMQALGAELRTTPGMHLVSRKWRRPAAAFMRAVTKRP